MPLIGVIAKKKDIKEIKRQLGNMCEFVEITDKSIKNLRNIKFEGIIIDKDIKCDKEEYKYINDIIKNSNYILKNLDVKIEKLKEVENGNIITYGFNSKAIISISSVKDDYIIVSIQKEIEKLNKKKIENQEKKIEILNEKNTKIYNKLIVFIIKELHNL